MEFKLGTNDFAVAVAAVGMAAVAAWRLDAVPLWLAIIPLVALVSNYAALGVYQVLQAHLLLQLTRGGRP